MEAVKMGASTRLIPGVLIGILLIGGPLAYSYHRQRNLRNFREVQEGVLYRSGQLSLAGLKQVVHDHGIRTVISLRDVHDHGDKPKATPKATPRATLPPDWAEEEYCDAEAIRYFRISPKGWSADDGSVPAEEGVRLFRRVMDDPSNYPVLLHCFAGIHRTGAFCAIYQMEYEHWTNEQALAELRAHGYTELGDEWNLLSYLQRYRPRWQHTSCEW
jgi:tyrosine-protein phosphatase SIW14